MTTTLTLAIFAALCLFVRLAMHLSEHGLIGVAYLISARCRAIGDGIFAYRLAHAEYRRQALEAAPRPVIEVRAPVRSKPALLGRLARIVGKAARRPAEAWRVPARERAEESA